MSRPSTLTDFAALEAALEEKRAAVEAALPGLLRRGAPEVDAAVEYSLLAPAKRVRPLLTLMVAELFRLEPRLVLPAACAVEMAHTASLILDDLPSMDDAQLRRGRATCHRVHGEANAVLAAFALLNRAFELLAEGWPGGPDGPLRAALARELAGAVGTEGMIAGQARDLAVTDREIDFATLEFIHSRKTGALFVACAAMGAVAAAASPADTAAIKAYAKNLGLAFQIVDDLIDVTGASQEAGKDVGQDLKKTTFVSFSGVEGAGQLARELA
ncbi:MAG TPA: polyprenyl synthetase family protein, partial [Vicinamibacteria bacterium]|nr:polyprenyl synthetase family protein [Vicinamibacteria bacterium]